MMIMGLILMEEALMDIMMVEKGKGSRYGSM